jgi:putative addiction module component (TIGR02574 family)
MSDAEVAKILELPIDERLRLVEVIWESVAVSPSAVTLGEAHRAVIGERLAEHRQSPDDVLTLEQLWAEVRRPG